MLFHRCWPSQPLWVSHQAWKVKKEQQKLATFCKRWALRQTQRSWIGPLTHHFLLSRSDNGKLIFFRRRRKRERRNRCFYCPESDFSFSMALLWLWQQHCQTFLGATARWMLEDLCHIPGRGPKMLFSWQPLESNLLPSAFLKQRREIPPTPALPPQAISPHPLPPPTLDCEPGKQRTWPGSEEMNPAVTEGTRWSKSWAPGEIP